MISVSASINDEPANKTNIHILAVDALADKMLADIYSDISKVRAFLRDNIVINFLSVDENAAIELNHFVFILTSTESAERNIRKLEADFNLKNRCHLLVVITIDCHASAYNNTHIPDLPKGFRLIRIEPELASTSADSYDKNRVTSLLLSLITSCFSDGYCCIDATELISFCAMYEQIDYVRFDRAGRSESFNGLAQRLSGMQYLGGVFVCVNNNSGPEPLESLVVCGDQIEEHAAGVELVLLSVPFFYGERVGCLGLDVFFGMRQRLT
ncbi:MAG: hypothetical protein Q8S94_00435 [Pseudohongiella sp.]|nr:hypothetical protein [Pseudohongiella sp.]